MELSLEVLWEALTAPSAASPPRALIAPDAAAAEPGGSARRRRSATPTRDREKAELRTLRAAETQLEGRLRALRASVASPRGVRGRQAVLRFVARRQLALRRDAERRNRCLRGQVAAQHRLSRELIARMAAQVSAGLHQPHYLLSEGDQRVLERLAGGVDRIYDMTPTAFPDDSSARRVECASAVDRFLESMGAEVADGAAVQLPGCELRDDRELPYDFYRVIDATWRAMTAWHAGANGAGTGWITSRSFPGVERPEHTFAVRVRLQSEVQSRLPVFFSEKVVVRRYIEPGRFVVVWLGSYDGEVELLGSRTVELGWIVVEQLPELLTADDAARRERVRIRLFGRVIPAAGDLSTQSSGQILAITSTKSCREDFSFVYRYMGQLLSASSASESAA